jgi:hypothetical protein
MDLSAVFGAILRHGVSAAGVYLVAKGYVSPDEVGGLVEVVSGAVIAVGTVVWSYFRTKKLKAG